MKKMLLACLSAGVLSLGLVPMANAADTVDLDGHGSDYWCSAATFDDAKCKAAEAAEKNAAATPETRPALTDEQKYCDVNSKDADVAKCNALTNNPAPETRPALTDKQKYCDAYIDGQFNPDADVAKCNALTNNPAPETRPALTDKQKYCDAYIDGQFNPDADVAKCNALTNNPAPEENKTPDTTETNKDSDKKVVDKKVLATTGASVGLVGGAAALLTLAGGAAVRFRKSF